MNPNTDFETVTTRGDHGEITFRKSDGVVVSRDFDSGYENDPDAGYPFILWANPETLTQDPTDILRVGYYFPMPGGAVCYELPTDQEELTADPLPRPEKPMKPFDLAKVKAGAPVVTRDGRIARAIDTQLKHSRFCLVAAVALKNGNESIFMYTDNGRLYDDTVESVYDLFMAPVKREGWVNIYPATAHLDGPGAIARTYSVYAAKEQAAANALGSIATVRVEWEE